MLSGRRRTLKKKAEALIKRLVEAGAGGEIPWRNVAVFYRINMQSRPLEEAARRRGIPYQVVKGQRFFRSRRSAGYGRLFAGAHPARGWRGILAHHQPPAPGAGAGAFEGDSRRRRPERHDGRCGGPPWPKAASGERPRGVSGTCFRTLQALASLRAGPARLIEEVLERTGYRAWLAGAAQKSASVERRRAAARAIEGAGEFAAAARAFEDRILEEEGRIARNG